MFLKLRFRKEPMMMYDSTLDVAMEVIQDFLNCDPMDIGKLQANTYDTVYNIEKEIKEKITVLDKDELKEVIKFIDQLQEDDFLWSNDTINNLKK